MTRTWRPHPFPALPCLFLLVLFSCNLRSDLLYGTEVSRVYIMFKPRVKCSLPQNLKSLVTRSNLVPSSEPMADASGILASDLSNHLVLHVEPISTSRID